MPTYWTFSSKAIIFPFLFKVIDINQFCYHYQRIILQLTIPEDNPVRKLCKPYAYMALGLHFRRSQNKLYILILSFPRLIAGTLSAEVHSYHTSCSRWPVTPLGYLWNYFETFRSNLRATLIRSRKTKIAINI